MKVVINKCYGGFGLSDAAYEKLSEWGVPVRKYVEAQRNPKRKDPDPNAGEVIFDRILDEDPKYLKMRGRYWDTWISSQREHPLLVRVVEELGEKANGEYAELKVVEIPDDVDWEIDDYDGREHIAQKHETWG